ncbi:MAG: MBL fold metallo-hydrolase, partial [Acidobacteria bacterium]|nr:MBL fold metallo-hydrolase [Acidobacteriota bacterium]
SDYPHDLFFGAWGDVRKRIYFSTWYLEPEGIRYPRQWDVETNGQPLQTITITKIDFHPTVANGAFDISADVKASFAKQKVAINDLPLGWRARKQPEELAKDFVQIPGAWNIALVKQNDGIVILEAPISTGYSARVLEEVAKRFPGIPVKAVVTTSDSWPHIGGLREYVARGISIYALDHNRPILERIIAVPHSLNPDALERKPQKPKLTFVTQRTSLGAGPNRMDLIPVRSETGERMMLIYFPEHSVLYASDLIQRQGDGSWWMPEYLLEVREAAEREKLHVEKVLAMHLTPTAWTEILAGIEKAKAAEKTGQK